MPYSSMYRAKSSDFPKIAPLTSSISVQMRRITEIAPFCSIIFCSDTLYSSANGHLRRYLQLIEEFPVLTDKGLWSPLQQEMVRKSANKVTTVRYVLPRHRSPASTPRMPFCSTRIPRCPSTSTLSAYFSYEFFNYRFLNYVLITATPLLTKQRNVPGSSGSVLRPASGHFQLLAALNQPNTSNSTVP